MKGLLLSCLSKKAEAYELVRRGLKVPLAPPMAWLCPSLGTGLKVDPNDCSMT